ncbi:MAG: hypothetical protein ACXADH_01940 [Candidatus Kariarchaeaceae archaeon]|jgi:hypothetical protein
MAKRKYTKKNMDYWNKVSSKSSEKSIDFSGNSPQPVMPSSTEMSESIGSIDWSEDSETSSANYSRTGNSALTTRVRDNAVGTYGNPTRFASVNALQMPFEHKGKEDVVSISTAIELCMKAYANVSIVRNTVESMVDFCVSDIYFVGGSKQSKKFFRKWFEEIDQTQLAEEFFREYHVSSNIFIHRREGKVSPETMKRLRRSNLTETKIPVKYIILNPKEISKTSSTVYSDSSLVKVLSGYEVQNLKNPRTEADKRIFNSLPVEVQEKIKNRNFYRDGVYMDLPNDEIISCFAQKQAYQPFGIPYLYPILDDINLKLQLKNTDEQISRTVENVVLLVTHGTKPDEGGVNSLVLNRLQELFRNRSVGRTIVADYTTQAEFIIPDLNKVIGPEKYKVVNEDIKDGLQNLLIGNDTVGNLQTKAQLFLEKVNRVRDKYINDFLYPEMKRVGEKMGFRDIPKPKFVEISLQDKTGVQRVVTRLIELGILHPEDGLKAIEKNIFPEADQLKDSQEKYVDERKQGFYNPLIGGVPMMEGAESNVPTGVPSQENGRPITASINGMRDFYSNVENLQSFASKVVKKSLKKRKLTEDQQEAIDSLCKDVILSTDMQNWENQCRECLEDFSKVKNLTTKKEIKTLGEDYKIDELSAAILYHS